MAQLEWGGQAILRHWWMVVAKLKNTTEIANNISLFENGYLTHEQSTLTQTHRHNHRNRFEKREKKMDINALTVSL